MKKIQLFILLTLLALYGCYKPSDYDPQPNDTTTITIQPKVAEIYANGADVDTLLILIPDYADAGKRKITLKASAGVFVNSGNDSYTISVDHTDAVYPNKRYAYVPFSGGLTSGSAKITGTVQNMMATASITLKFDTAETVKVEADRFYLTNFGEANLTATVSGTKTGRGKPSVGQKVFYSAATDSEGKNLIGAFRAVIDKTNDKGIATAIYSCDPTYQGEVYIFAKILKAVNDTTFAKFKIYKTKQ